MKRLFSSCVLLIAITCVSFGIMQLAPGDPTSLLETPGVTQENMALIKQNLGLDKPIYVQYKNWLLRAVSGDLGVSYATGEPVMKMIVTRLPATLIMSITAFALM